MKWYVMLNHNFVKPSFEGRHFYSEGEVIVLYYVWLVVGSKFQ